MKQHAIVILFLSCMLLPTSSTGQIAGSPGLGGTTGLGGSTAAGMGGIAGVSGTTYAGVAGLGGALVARRRYIGVRVEGTDYLSALLPLLGLLSLGAVLVTMTRPRLLHITDKFSNSTT
jgi:hypothetical protein